MSGCTGLAVPSVSLAALTDTLIFTCCHEVVVVWLTACKYLCCHVTCGHAINIFTTGLLDCVQLRGRQHFLLAWANIGGALAGASPTPSLMPHLHSLQKISPKIVYEEDESLSLNVKMWTFKISLTKKSGFTWTTWKTLYMYIVVLKAAGNTFSYCFY